MLSDELYTAFRDDVADVAEPYLWSDDEVYRYMNDAYMMYFRLIGGVGDVRNDDVTLVDIVTGEAFADLHPSILTIRGAFKASDNKPVEVINFQNLESMATTDYSNVMALSMDMTPGPVESLIIGMEPNLCRWVKVPATDDQVRLYVYRLPVDPITGGGQDFVDLDERHHIHLLRWMKHLAYSKQDAETFDLAKAKENEVIFRQYCEQARLEWERYRRKPRTVAYGGI